jgi:hypothetical protein
MEKRVYIQGEPEARQARCIFMQCLIPRVVPLFQFKLIIVFLGYFEKVLLFYYALSGFVKASSHSPHPLLFNLNCWTEFFDCFGAVSVPLNKPSMMIGFSLIWLLRTP